MRYTEKIFSQAEIEKNVCFTTVPGYDDAHTETTLRMDVYAPAGDCEKGRRGIILVHGGGFVANTKEQDYIVILANELAKYGYVCFSIEYRLFPMEKKPVRKDGAAAAVADIEAARRFITENGTRFGIDPEKLSICGGSTGGMAGIDACKVYPYKNFVCLWGGYAGMEIPKEYVSAFIVHGTADESVPYEFGTELCEKIKAGGNRCQMITLEGAKHTAIDRYDQFGDAMVQFLDEGYR